MPAASSPEPPTGRVPRAAIVRLGILALTLGGLTVAAALAAPDVSPDRLRDEGERLGAWAAVVLVPLYVLVNTAAIPSPILAGAAGLMFGTLLGGALAHAGAVAAAVTQMLLTRHVARDQAAALLPKRLRGLDDFLERRGFFAVLYYRIVPGLPFLGLNYAAGLSRLRVRDMALGTAIGKAPRTFAYAALGGSLTDLSSPTARIAIGALAALAIGGALLARREVRAERAAAPGRR